MPYPSNLKANLMAPPFRSRSRMLLWSCLWFFFWPVITLGLVLELSNPGMAGAGDQPGAISPGPTYLRSRQPCPQELDVLVTGLLRDLPSYANRVASRHLGRRAEQGGFGTLLVAGRAEFEPLELGERSQASLDAAPDVQQVFFTTLERQYIGTQAVTVQQFHWLFVTPGEEGWYPVMLFSRLGQTTPSSDRPPSPPQEASNGVVGQGIRLWLRDCRARAIAPIDSDAVNPAAPSPSLD